jgi:hypothetical protein
VAACWWECSCEAHCPTTPAPRQLSPSTFTTLCEPLCLCTALHRSLTQVPATSTALLHSLIYVYQLACGSRLVGVFLRGYPTITFHLHPLVNTCTSRLLFACTAFAGTNHLHSPSTQPSTGLPISLWQQAGGCLAARLTAHHHLSPSPPCVNPSTSVLYCITLHTGLSHLYSPSAQHCQRLSVGMWQQACGSVPERLTAPGAVHTRHQ